MRTSNRSTYWTRCRSPMNSFRTRSRACFPIVVGSEVQPVRETQQIVGIWQQQPFLTVGDLVLDATHRTGHYRTAHPHRLGDGEPEPLDEALLHHHRRMALHPVDDDRVLIDVIHRNGHQVASCTYRGVHPFPRVLGWSDTRSSFRGNRARSAQACSRVFGEPCRSTASSRARRGLGGLSRPGTPWLPGKPRTRSSRNRHWR